MAAFIDPGVTKRQTSLRGFVHPLELTFPCLPWPPIGSAFRAAVLRAGSLMESPIVCRLADDFRAGAEMAAPID